MIVRMRQLGVRTCTLRKLARCFQPKNAPTLTRPRYGTTFYRHLTLCVCNWGQIPIKSLGYPELAQLLRRSGVATEGQNREQMSDLFRRMVFNLLIDNTDDHEKNYAC